MALKLKLRSGLATWLVLPLVAFSPVAMTCTEDGTEGIVEKNSLYIPANQKNLKSNVTEEKFNEVIDDISAIYAPLIRREFNARLNVQKNWQDGTVNAYASRSGSTWNVVMFGGLARHETITPDGFGLVVCHEIGHHIGGAPKKGGLFGSWATNEGQADYFATLKCLRKYFEAKGDTDQVLAQLQIPESLVISCQEQFSSETEVKFCLRGAMAGMSTARLFQVLRNQTTPPSFSTPDPTVVTRTDHNHPQTQCRLDTYYQGALCNRPVDEAVSQKNELDGVCDARRKDHQGTRPLCWFKASNSR